MTDKQIRELAEKHGFWGADYWWKENIPKFHHFIKEIVAMSEESVSTKINDKVV